MLKVKPEYKILSQARSGQTKWAVVQLTMLTVIVAVGIFYFRSQDVKFKPRSAVGKANSILSAGRSDLDLLKDRYVVLEANQKQILKDQQKQEQQRQRCFTEAGAAQRQRIRADYERRHQEIIKIANSELASLNREYQIREQAMQRKYEAVPKNQRDEKWSRRAWEDYNNLVTGHKLAVEKICSKRDLDIELPKGRWEAEQADR